MHQSSLALTSPTFTTALPGDATGFDIGWEHAQNGLVPAPELLLEGTAVSQGWRAARAVLGRRNATSTRALRQWLALRSLAWREGADFDTSALGPADLARLETGRCPVRRRPLGGASGAQDAPTVFRLNLAGGYRPGNLVVLSGLAAQAAQGRTVADALRQARTAEAGGMAVRGLLAVEWRRLAVLLSFSSPLALHEAARLPLLVLPTPGITPRCAVQALQLQLTLQFQLPGWSARARALAATLDHDAQRTDFHLFVSALASRVMEAGLSQVSPSAEALCNTALVDAWVHERVQRRWQQLALSLGDAGCAALLRRVQALPARSGGTILRHPKAGSVAHQLSDLEHRPGGKAGMGPTSQATALPARSNAVPAPAWLPVKEEARPALRPLNRPRLAALRPGSALPQHGL